MSRSRRYTPIIGVGGAASEKAEKRQWHRRWRAKQRAQLARYTAGQEVFSVDFREVSNPWSMAKDGKSRLFGLEPLPGSKQDGKVRGDTEGSKFRVDENRVSVKRWHKLIGK